MKVKFVGAKRLAVAITVLVVALFATSASVGAYNLFGGKWSSVNPLVFCVSASYDDLSYRWLDGLYYWRQAANPPFTYQTSCTTNLITLLDANYSAVDWDGVTHLDPSLTANPYTSGYATLNWYFLQNYVINKRISVASHELGHVLGLDHNTGCVLMVIDSATRYDTCGIYTPQSDDVAGVQALYP